MPQTIKPSEIQLVKFLNAAQKSEGLEREARRAEALFKDAERSVGDIVDLIFDAHNVTSRGKVSFDQDRGEFILEDAPEFTPSGVIESAEVEPVSPDE